MTAVLEFHTVCTDVLGDTAGLSCNNIRFAYIVEQRGLTVVNVTHYGNYRWTWYEILLIVRSVIALDGIGNLSGDELNLVAELFRNEHKSLGVEALVD